MKVLITAPSLDETENVSGISTVVRQITAYSNFEYAHFLAGSRDGEKRNLAWLARQITLPLKFWNMIRRDKPDVVNISTAMNGSAIWRDAVLAKVARFARKPIVLSLHGGHFLMNDFESPALERKAAKMLHRAKTVVVLSENEKESVLRRWPDLKICVLPNAVPLTENLKVERDNPVPVVIFLGRLHESKGLAAIVESCRKLCENRAQFEFRCFGDGPMKAQFIDQMTEILNEKFYYGGVLTGAEKWRQLAEADIFLLPSLYGEGLPMAMLEAMTAGCIVVVSEMASVGSVINDGINGYLVEPGNVGQLSERLQTILANRKGWETIRENAVETVRQKFALTDYIKQLEEIYADAAA